MRGDRPADLKYLIQLAQAAEINGFEAVLTPTGLWCEDAWLSTAMLIGSTESLKYLVAFRPGLISPTLAAQMATTFQWQSQGRLMLNVVTGGESIEQRAFGDFLEKQDRYARCGEFLDIVRRLWTSDSPVTAAGEHLRVEQASLARRPDPLPPVFFGGSSPEAGQVAARYADTYLTWGERPEQVKEKLDWIRGLAAAQGRQLSYGLRVHVISRDTSEQAWAEAERLLNGLSPETVAAAQQSLARSESVGQRRMRQLHGGGEDYTAGVDARQLEIYPNLWSGVGLVRGGAGTALVGSHAEVADRIAEYAELGLDHFILSGYPHLEEAYIFGEGVRPILAERGLLDDSARLGHAAQSRSGRRSCRTSVRSALPSQETQPTYLSASVPRTYSGLRAIAATGSGLRASAPITAGRGLFRPDRRQRSLRRQPLPAARRQVPRQGQLGHVPDLPKGAADPGLVGVRRPSRRGVRVCADRRRVGLASVAVRRVLRTCGGGMPNLQLESLGQVVCARRDTHGSSAAEVTQHPDGARRRPHGQ